MAKPHPSFFTNVFLRQNPKSIQNSSPNSSIRDRNFSILGESVGSEGSILSNLDDKRDDKQQHLIEIANDVSRIIRTRPRWEQTLMFDFPGVNFSDQNLCCEILKQQKNVIMALRFYHWVSTRSGFSPDLVSSDVVFRGLVRAKAGSLAKSFLENTKFVPKPSSLEPYIECLCYNGLIEEALAVIDELKGVGYCLALSTWNSALFGSIKAGKSGTVWKLYEDMMGCGVTGDADTIGYLIYALSMDNNHSKGYELMGQLLDTGHAPKNVVFNKLIYESCKSKEFYRMTGLLFSMIDKNCSPDIYTYQELIHGVRDSKCRDGLEVFRIFEYIKKRGYAPDMVMYSTVIHSLVKSKMLGKAKKVWVEMIQKGFVPNKYTYNALMYGYLKSGNINEAERLCKEMFDKGYVDSTLTYNILISGFCANGMFMKAYRLFQHMVKEGVARDYITFNSLIKGLSSEGCCKAVYGLNIFFDILEHGLKPPTTLYGFLVKKLFEEGHANEAKWLLNARKAHQPLDAQSELGHIGLARLREVFQQDHGGLTS
ncbi:unnamed protein product [Cuscuta campestris]|uniref:Pentacotripeptide-repeat region of PRORP domain-containing protein n=1 Tax=Cuscuta campestris TaxID=132261 RepID=A0A484L0A2_9ASTE|nr:unnamed protein product [Cuscuta campestris]